MACYRLFCDTDRWSNCLACSFTICCICVFCLKWCSQAAERKAPWSYSCDWGTLNRSNISYRRNVSFLENSQHLAEESFWNVMWDRQFWKSQQKESLQSSFSPSKSQTGESIFLELPVGLHGNFLPCKSNEVVGMKRKNHGENISTSELLERVELLLGCFI